jgi:xylonate dehydratase
MEEIFAITSALRYLDFGKHVAVITDARFSGVSTGACIGHVTPEALAGGPIGKVREGDRIAIAIDRERLTGEVNLVVDGSAEAGARELALRPCRPISPPTPLCRPKRAYGPRCRT